jgi:hypothetical protein
VKSKNRGKDKGESGKADKGQEARGKDKGESEE